MASNIVRIASDKKVASQSAVGADWQFYDVVFQQRFETPLIEGVEVLGKSTVIDKDGPNETIIDELVLYMPGEEGFDDAFWNYVLGDDYKLVNGVVAKGGSGSGNFGHIGRPGKRGGSGGASGLSLEQVVGGLDLKIVRTISGGRYMVEDKAKNVSVRDEEQLREMLHPTILTSKGGVELQGFKGEMGERAVKLIDSLPESHLAYMGQVKAMDSWDVRILLGREYAGTSGVYDTLTEGKPNIIINRDAKTIGQLETPLGRKTLAHEVGHGVLHKLHPESLGDSTHVLSAGKYGKGMLTGNLSGAQARQQLTSMYGEVESGSRKAVSPYAKTTQGEWFAESYGYYVTSPGELKSADSGMYNFMRDNLFGGKEYGASTTKAAHTLPQWKGKPTVTREDGRVTLGDPDEVMGARQ